MTKFHIFWVARKTQARVSTIYLSESIYRTTINNLNLHMFSCLIKLDKLLCLKSIGKTSFARRFPSRIWKLLPLYQKYHGKYLLTGSQYIRSSVLGSSTSNFSLLKKAGTLHVCLCMSKQHGTRLFKWVSFTKTQPKVIIIKKSWLFKLYISPRI